MKRLWIRAHALREVRRLTIAAIRDDGGSSARAADEVAVTRAYMDHPDDNAMVTVEISDELAEKVRRDGFLMAAGRVLKDGEEPPYLGEEGKQAR